MSDGGLGAPALFAALEATWPPQRWQACPGWRIGVGAGGGKRVSAGVATAPGADAEALVAAQAALGQPPLAMIRPNDAALDAALASAGWARIDPTVALVAPVARLATPPPRLTAFEVNWPPLGVQAEIWRAGGIGPERCAVMGRAAGPAVALLGRGGDTPGATAFVACHGGIAMVHALEVLPAMRRRGLGRHLMQAAALWAAGQGAHCLAALVTRANAPALALYGALGMAETTEYHYRLREDPP